jgi:hypothetical protein
MPYGVIGEAKDGFPLKPGYHMLRLFTDAIQPGWRAMKIEGATDGCIISAARGPKGEMTILALNQTERMREITATVSDGRSLNAITWNHDGRGEIASGEVATPQAGAYRLSLPPLGLTALTTQEFSK